MRHQETENVQDNLSTKKSRRKQRDDKKSNKKVQPEKSSKKTDKMKIKKGKKRIVNASKDVSTLFPIESIDSGIIKTKDARYLKIFEVLPINFNMRSEDEQYAVVQGFMGTMNFVKNKIQFKIISQKTNTAEHENSITYAESQDAKHPQKQLLTEYLKFVRELGRNTSIARKFYVIIEYVRSKEDGTGFEAIYESLMTDAIIISAALGNCGNESKLSNNVVNENYNTLENLYNILNPRSSMVESFPVRFERVWNDLQDTADDVDHLDVDFNHLLFPRGVKFKASYSVIDGEYVSFLYIKSKGYPNVPLSTGWAGNYMQLGEGVTYDIILEKLDKDDVRNKLFLLKRSEVNNAFDKSLNDYNSEDVQNKIASMFYIESSLNNNQDLYNMYIIFTIHAPTLKQLKTKQRTCRTQLRNQGFSVDEATMLQKQAYTSTMPFLALDPIIAEASRRNITTYSVGGSYPFSAFEMCDRDGVLTGLNAHNESLLIQNIFNTREYANANMLVTGSSGSGKSFFLQMLAGRYRLRQCNVYAILPLKGHEFKKGVLAHGGQFISLYPGSVDCINIMDIATYDTSVVKSDDDEDDLDVSAGPVSLMTEKVNQIVTWFYLIRPDMTEDESKSLENAIINTYAAFNITADNNSIIDPKTGQIRRMPTLRDLYNTLYSDTATSPLAKSLSPFAVGAAKNMSGQTNVSLDNKYIVFDVSHAPEKQLAAFMFIALDFIWAKCREDRTQNKILILDEVWKLMNANDEVAKFILEIFKIIRGYGGGAWAATQDISDFFMYKEGIYSKGIVAAARTKVLLRFEEEESKTVQKVLGLNNSERRLLSTIRMQGEGLICHNNNKIHFFGRPTQYELGLYTTDAKQIKQQKELEKQQREQKKFEETQGGIDNFMDNTLPGSLSEIQN